MGINHEDLKHMEQLADWFEEHQSEIPNCDRLIHKLRKNQQLGHLVNAEFTKRFHEDGAYKVTDVEASDGTHDVDIQLDDRINIQTWHGQNTAGHIIESQFDHKGRERNIRLGNISSLGGVKTDWDKDCEVMSKKLKQLPDDKLGIVLLLDRFVGVTVLPEWWQEIPDNKCVIKLNFTSYDAGFQNVYGEAIVYHSNNFQQMEEAKRVIASLGFNFKTENIP